MGTGSRAEAVKYVKWAALILVALAIIAAVVQWRRDSIALEIANRVLKDTDFVVASISVRKLGVDHIELSSIVLETPGGTQYDVAGVNYPLKTRDRRHIEVESLAMTWGSVGTRAPSYTDLARTILALPETLADTDVRVQRLSVQALPELSGISWTTSGRGQTFAAEVAGLGIEATVTQPTDDTHEVRIAASDSGGTSALRGSLSFTDREQRIGVDGNLQTDVAALEPLLRALGWVPVPAEMMTATVDGLVAVDLDVDGDGNLAIRFEPTLSKGSSLTWRSEDEVRIGMTLAADTSVDVVLAYPSLEWTLEAQQVHAALRLDDGNTVTTTISDLLCRTGVQCTLRAAARTGPVAWGDVEVEAINVRQASGVTFGLDEEGWSAEIERLDLAISELHPAENLLASFELVVSDLEMPEGLSSIQAAFRSSPGAGHLQYGAFEFLVPGVEGTITLAGDVLTSSLRLFDRASSLSANINLDYDVAGARGSARVRDGLLDFGRRKLSERVAGWPYAWDVIAGTWTVTADLEWTMAPGELQYASHSTHRIEGLAGVYNDIGMAGMATTLEVDLDSTAALAIRPATLSMDLVDVGVPINNVTATVTPDVADLAVQVDGLSGTVLGGRFSVDPFTYALAAERNEMRVRLERVQPQFMVDLAEFEQLKVTGTMSGMLPVTLVENAVRIDGGSMANDPPGGVIRYRAGEAGAGSNEQLAMVTGALSNFVYDSLTANVDYTETGNLKLGMRLEGINPDRDPTQPIILNLNVDNNIPQMLRSLQAVRSIEDILERRAGN